MNLDIDTTSQIALEKFRCTKDPNVLNIFENNSNPIFRTALNAINDTAHTGIYPNPSGKTFIQFHEMVVNRLSDNSFFMSSGKYIADKSVILDKQTTRLLFKAFIEELQYNPNIKITYLIDLYINEFKVQILNTIPEGRPDLYHDNISDKATYLSNCINEVQQGVITRGDLRDTASQSLINQDRDNFPSYMNILDRIKPKNIYKR